MRAFILCVLFACALCATSNFMDIWEEIDDANCTIKTYTDICLRVYQSTGKIEPNFAKNVAHLKGLNVNLSAYVMPAITVDAATQVADVLAAIKGLKLKMLWVCVEGTWTSDRTQNHEILNKFITGFKAAGITPGIQTDDINWQRIMGRDRGDYATYKLWFIRQDKRPDGGFRPFGGWRNPAAKQYEGAAELCGDTYNRDAYWL